MEDGQNTHSGANGDGMNGGAKIGRILEQKRKEMGLSLDEVEQATKIRKRYLTGLEREDYAMLPDAVYARGFLKTYANYLGLDGEALSHQLKSRRKPRRERGIDYNNEPRTSFEQPLITPSGLTGTEKRKISTSAIVTLIVALLALAAIIGTLYFVGRGVQASRSQEENPPASSGNPPHQEQKVASKDRSPEDGQKKEEENEVKQNSASVEETTGAQQSSAPPDTLQVLVSVVERPSWLLIRTDGSRAYEQVAQPGFSETFEAERKLYIKSGDAGAVRVEINGQDAGVLGETGQVVAKSYSLKSAS